jgi:hypothetical protein
MAITLVTASIPPGPPGSAGVEGPAGGVGPHDEPSMAQKRPVPHVPHVIRPPQSSKTVPQIRPAQASLAVLGVQHVFALVHVWPPPQLPHEMNPPHPLEIEPQT